MSNKKKKDPIVKCDKCKFYIAVGVHVPNKGSKPFMRCDHPKADDYGYIISWDKRKTYRTSAKCPLLKNGILFSTLAGMGD